MVEEDDRLLLGSQVLIGKRVYVGTVSCSLDLNNLAYKRKSKPKTNDAASPSKRIVDGPLKAFISVTDESQKLEFSLYNGSGNHSRIAEISLGNQEEVVSVENVADLNYVDEYKDSEIKNRHTAIGVHTNPYKNREIHKASMQERVNKETLELYAEVESRHGRILVEDERIVLGSCLSEKIHKALDHTVSSTDCTSTVGPESDRDLDTTINSDLIRDERKDNENELVRHSSPLYENEKQTISIIFSLSLDTQDEVSALKSYIERSSVEPRNDWDVMAITTEVEEQLVGRCATADLEQALASLAIKPVVDPETTIPISNLTKDDLVRLASTPLMEFSDYEILKVFRLKLRFCCISWKNIMQLREFKHLLLTDIIRFFNTARLRNILITDEVVLHDVVRMISLNIFRPLKLDSKLGKLSEEEINKRNDIEFQDLAIMYELLLLIVESDYIPVQAKKRCFDEIFCMNFMQNFGSLNVREREFVKTITHCLYSKIVGHRVCMRKAMGYAFLAAIHDKVLLYSYAGIAEILEVYGSIVSGFVKPLKKEHRNMLIKCLIPLHSVQGSEYFHEQLVFVLIQFISKEEELASHVVRGILRYWPIRSATKQVLYMSEMEEILAHMPSSQFSSIQDALIRRICLCIESGHFQVAEYAMALLNTQVIYNRFFEDSAVRKKYLPMILLALGNAANGWSRTVRQAAQDMIGFIHGNKED